MDTTSLTRKTALGRASVFALCVFATCLLTREVRAEVGLVEAGGWEVFTSGRLGGFVTYVKGDGFPITQLDPVTMNATQTPLGGGIDTNSANGIADPTMPTVQPHLESMRVRSGFLGNILGMGFRRHVTEYTTMSGYIELWSDIESNGRRKYVPMPVDVRQGYTRLDGHWGSLSVGRQLTLFSRGAAEIDFLYGHGYGVGFVPAVDNSGTAAGHVGTGVLGPGFASGVIYTTPQVAGGLVLNVGIFDPVSLQGAWDRTKWVRPEGELTYDFAFGSRGKLHVFVNGGYQKAYRVNEPDSVNTTAYGTGYGARLEVGPVHLGVAGHYGQGLGLFYALETTDAAYDQSPLHRLRKSDGYYAQAQVVVAKFDLNAGAGIARVTPLGPSTENIGGVETPIPADGDMVGGNRQSIIKYQLGMSAAVVYHVTPSLHVDLDYFRAQFRWQLGEHQNVNFVNTGITMTW